MPFSSVPEFRKDQNNPFHRLVLLTHAVYRELLLETLGRAELKTTVSLIYKSHIKNTKISISAAPKATSETDNHMHKHVFTYYLCSPVSFQSLRAKAGGLGASFPLFCVMCTRLVSLVFPHYLPLVFGFHLSLGCLLLLVTL